MTTDSTPAHQRVETPRRSASPAWLPDKGRQPQSGSPPQASACQPIQVARTAAPTQRQHRRPDLEFDRENAPSNPEHTSAPDLIALTPMAIAECPSPAHRASTWSATNLHFFECQSTASLLCWASSAQTQTPGRYRAQTWSEAEATTFTTAVALDHESAVAQRRAQKEIQHRVWHSLTSVRRRRADLSDALSMLQHHQRFSTTNTLQRGTDVAFEIRQGNRSHGRRIAPLPGSVNLALPHP